MSTIEPQSYVRAVKRRQYQSCDRCRKGRRACDAIAHGVRPLEDEDSTHETTTRACSICLRANSVCTFDWLRALPEGSLPKALKRKSMDIQKHMASKLDNMESSGRTKTKATHEYDAQRMDKWSGANSSSAPGAHVSFQIEPPSLIFSKHQPVLEWEGPSSGWLEAGPSIHGNENSSSTPSSDNHGLDLSYYPESMPVTGWDSNIDKQQFHKPECQYGTNSTGFGTGPSKPAAQIMGDLQTHFIETCPLALLLDWQEIENPTVASMSSALTPSLYSNTVGSIAESYSSYLPDSDTEITQAADASTATQFSMSVNIQDAHLALSAGKTTVISGLTQVYNDSMENAIQCWLSAEDCPYVVQLPTNGIVRLQQQPLPASISLYERVHQLDLALDHIRTKPQTTGESAGASRSLKAVIMAFASQWSSRSNSKTIVGSATQTSTTAECDVEESREFENILRGSLWKEASKSLARWAHCESFLIILADLLFSLVEPVRNPGDGYQDSFKDAQGRIIHLERAVYQLLTWKKRIYSALTMEYINETSAAPKRIISGETIHHFNMVLWLGVMSDTISSVLNKRKLIISDKDTALISKNLDIETFRERDYPQHFTQPYPDSSRYSWPVADDNLWGRYLIDRQKQHYQPGQLQHRALLIPQAEKMLQQATSVKVLLWRKASALEMLLNAPTSAAAFERYIKEAFIIYEHWDATYGSLLDDCVSQFDNLPLKLQSWYILTSGHWHLASLYIADLIERIDNTTKSDSLKKSLRQSSCVTLEMQWSSTVSIAKLASMSCSSTVTSVDRDRFHFALRDTALLIEPWTDVLHQALLLACQTLLSWRRLWQTRQHAVSISAAQAWIYSKTNSGELSIYCISCIEALRLLGRKSELAAQSASALDTELLMQG